MRDEMMKGEVAGIARHAASRAPIEALDWVPISMEAGVDGDCHGEPGPRQVTVVSEEAWKEAIAELGSDLSWTLRRANLLLRGIDLRDSVGARLSCKEVILEICEENPPCFVMDRQHRGLRKALRPDWRAGVACRVVRGGTVRIGDRVSLAP
jgi:MOSC domain-containing protein YiiM